MTEANVYYKSCIHRLCYYWTILSFIYLGRPYKAHW